MGRTTISGLVLLFLAQGAAADVNVLYKNVTGLHVEGASEAFAAIRSLRDKVNAHHGRQLGAHITKELLEQFLADCENTCEGMIDATWAMVEANPDMENPDMDATMKIACEEKNLATFKCAVKNSPASCPEMVTGILKPVLCLCSCPTLAKLMPMTQLKKEDAVADGEESAVASAKQMKVLEELCPLTTEAFACVQKECAEIETMAIAEKDKPSKTCGPPQGVLDAAEGDCNMQKTARLACTSHKWGCKMRFGPGKCAEENHIAEFEKLPECNPIKDMAEIPETCCKAIKKTVECSIEKDYEGDKAQYDACFKITIGNKMSMSSGYDDAMYSYIEQCKDWGYTVDEVMAASTLTVEDPVVFPTTAAPATTESDFAFSLRGGTALLLPALFIAAFQ